MNHAAHLPAGASASRSLARHSLQDCSRFSPTRSALAWRLRSASSSSRYSSTRLPKRRTPSPPASALSEGSTSNLDQRPTAFGCAGRSAAPNAARSDGRSTASSRESGPTRKRHETVGLAGCVVRSFEAQRDNAVRPAGTTLPRIRDLGVPCRVGRDASRWRRGHRAAPEARLAPARPPVPRGDGQRHDPVRGHGELSDPQVAA